MYRDGIGANQREGIELFEINKIKESFAMIDPDYQLAFFFQFSFDLLTFLIKNTNFLFEFSQGQNSPILLSRNAETRVFFGNNQMVV